MDEVVEPDAAKPPHDIGLLVAFLSVLAGFALAVSIGLYALHREADHNDANLSHFARVQTNLCDGRNDDRLAIIEYVDALSNRARLVDEARVRFRPIDCKTGLPVPTTTTTTP